MFSSRVLTALFSLLLIAFFQPAQADDKRWVTIGTGSETGVYFPAGGAICRFINRERDRHNLHCSVEATGGSLANLKALAAGEIDVGIVQSDWQYNAYFGKGAMKQAGANEGLRTLFSLHGEPFTVVARTDSGIKSFEDLRGKRVNFGDQGSGARATMEALMQVKGWSYKDFSGVMEYKASEQAQALCSGKIDAMIFAAGHPNGAIHEVTSLCAAKLISVDGADVDKLVAEQPYYAKMRIPGGMYKGNAEAVTTFGVKATVVTTDKLPDDIAYEMVKGVFDNLDSFKTLHFVFSSLDKETMVRAGIIASLHPGALKYYTEKGLVK